MSPRTEPRPIFILNGPNLNRLGTREPAIYGRTTLAEIEAQCRASATGHAIVFMQTNSESELVGWVHQAIDEARAIVINPAGYSFTSVALLDALRMFPGPIVEVHLSNIHARPPPHRDSLISQVATGVIAGLGPRGYLLALAYLIGAALPVGV
jgi:3-dehydroquinate dehydratase-2